MIKTYIIAEAGVNHNGRLDLALQLCDAAKEAGADAVKFQTWKTEKIVTKSAELAEYQHENITEKSQSQFEMLKALELSYESFKQIKDYCDKIGIQFLSTPDEEESLDFLISLGLPFIKLGSGDVTNIPFLRIVGSKGVHVILSTGMSYMCDVDTAYRTLLQAGAKSVAVLHCTTNYPCPIEEVNLKAMLSIKSALGCEVGYSDHTDGITVPVAAVALGATVIEKHFTLDKTMEGPDHLASLDPQELKAMVNAIRDVERCLGDGFKQPNESEKKISSVVLKRIVASRPIKAGSVITGNDLMVKRSSSGYSAAKWDMVVNTVAKRDYQEDEPIEL